MISRTCLRSATTSLTKKTLQGLNDRVGFGMFLLTLSVMVVLFIFNLSLGDLLYTTVSQMIGLNVKAANLLSIYLSR
jgi:hypothetical protein